MRFGENIEIIASENVMSLCIADIIFCIQSNVFSKYSLRTTYTCNDSQIIFDVITPTSSF